MNEDQFPDSAALFREKLCPLRMNKAIMRIRMINVPDRKRDPRLQRATWVRVATSSTTATLKDCFRFNEAVCGKESDCSGSPPVELLRLPEAQQQLEADVAHADLATAIGNYCSTAS